LLCFSAPMERAAQDIRFGLRLFRRSPGFAISAWICLTLGVAVTTTIFSAVNGILLRPLPFPKSDELVVIHSENAAIGVTDSRVSMADYTAWRGRSHSFVDSAAWLANFPTITGEGEPERIDGAMISPAVFRILAVHPLWAATFFLTRRGPAMTAQSFFFQAAAVLVC
jgi:putative ABC transport system permease protein